MERGDAVRSWKARQRTSPGQRADLARLLPQHGLLLDGPAGGAVPGSPVLGATVLDAPAVGGAVVDRAPVDREPVDPAFLDPATVFGRTAPFVLEIGSGTGEATVAMAQADPDRDVLAVEVHVPGIVALLRRIEERGLRNVRVAEADGLHVLRRLRPGSLDEVRVYFPDPWPKAKHAKRRLVDPAFAALVAERLRPGGRLHVATDWPSYAAQVVDVVRASPELTLVGGERGGRPVTRFEARGIAAGRPPQDLVAVRR